MACLEMYNSNQHNGHFPPISPRISFSNDFADSQEIRNPNNSSSSSRTDFVSSDFEFSVSNYSMMSADELFFKGRLLPFKANSNQTQRTIRDELLAGDDDDDNNNGVSLRPPKSSSGSNRWKGFLGLKRNHIGSKRIDNKISENGSTRFRPGFANEDNNSQVTNHLTLMVSHGILLSIP